MLSKRVVIIGGGISGLSAAHELVRLKRAKNLPVEITLLESEKRLGGVIETVRQSDCLFECGPDSFISEKPAALELCRELGIGGEVVGTRPENQRSYVFSGGKLHRVPEGFYLIAPVRARTLFELPFISWPGKIRMACEPLIARKKNQEDESVGAFIRRRFGRETLEKVGQPMLSAVYGGDVARLSLQATFPRFQMMEEKYGSVVLALRALKKERGAEGTASGPRYSLFLALQNGMDVLIQKLTDEIRSDVRFMMDAKAVSLGRMERGWRIGLQKGMPVEADQVCCALPAPAAAMVFRTAVPELSRLLGNIRYESVVTVNLVFRQQDVPPGCDGFGFVVPETENSCVIGCTFSSRKYSNRSPENLFALRLFLGGNASPDLWRGDDPVILDLALRELRRLTGIGATPAAFLIRRYPEAMPQYEVGHFERLSQIDEVRSDYEGLFLTGNAYRGLGLPDCIRQARETAQAMVLPPPILK